MENHFFVFVHSLLRYGVLLTVTAAGLLHLRGWLAQKALLNGDRAISVWALILCHVQLVIGIILYALNWNSYYHMSGSVGRFWRIEHPAAMVIAIALVTFGRASSKRAKDERTKQKRIAIYYLIALVLILWAIPWPFREIGHGRGWI
ncbi:MAG: hypothetical protein JNM62_16600 [Flavobacteriales bacterium]|nr:hypothetical protein [Flavobacteriales bacterium]